MESTFFCKHEKDSKMEICEKDEPRDKLRLFADITFRGGNSVAFTV